MQGEIHEENGNETIVLIARTAPEGSMLTDIKHRVKSGCVELEVIGDTVTLSIPLRQRGPRQPGKKGKEPPSDQDIADIRMRKAEETPAGMFQEAQP